MTTATPKQSDEFFSALSGTVDPCTKTIVGAAIIQIGNVSDDRQMFADATTLQQVIQLAGESLRARINHDGVIGGYVGRWKNFRLDGDTVRADLQIAEVAAKARGPAAEGSNLSEYVLSIAEEDPGAIGVSIAPKLDRPAMLAARRADGRYPIRISALRAADLVDTPAATHSGLFSAGSSDSERISPVKILLLPDGSFAVINDDQSQTQLSQKLSDLSISVEMLNAHHPTLAKAIGDLAVTSATADLQAKAGETVKAEFFGQITKLSEAFGESSLSAILPVVKGEKDAATFRAEQAEARAAALAAENDKLKKGAGAPGFSASDAGTNAGSADSDADLKAAYAKDNQGFHCVEDFVAFEKAKAAGFCS